MKVSVSHHIDASEPDAAGDYDYYYEYYLYRFSDGRRSYVARAYADEPGQAAFLAVEEEGRNGFVGPADEEDALFVEAVAYLRLCGRTALSRLTEAEGYVPLGR